MPHTDRPAHGPHPPQKVWAHGAISFSAALIGFHQSKRSFQWEVKHTNCHFVPFDVKLRKRIGSNYIAERAVPYEEIRCRGKKMILFFLPADLPGWWACRRRTNISGCPVPVCGNVPDELWGYPAQPASGNCPLDSTSGHRQLGGAGRWHASQGAGRRVRYLRTTVWRCTAQARPSPFCWSNWPPRRERRKRAGSCAPVYSGGPGGGKFRLLPSAPAKIV